MEADERDPLRGGIAEFDYVLTYGGGDPVVRRYRALGARDCVPVYNALDPTTHHPVAARADLRADLSLRSTSTSTTCARRAGRPASSASPSASSCAG